MDMQAKVEIKSSTSGVLAKCKLEQSAIRSIGFCKSVDGRKLIVEVDC